MATIDYIFTMTPQNWLLEPMHFIWKTDPMNNRQLKAHKGFSNELTFNYHDRDRKLQNVFSDTVYAHIYNPTTKKRLLTRRCEDTSSVGIIKLYLNEGDLQNIDAGLI